MFFYLPWVPIGLVLAVLLVRRLHQTAPAAVARRGDAALAALGIAVAAKTFLIAQVNPEFRRIDITVDEIRSTAVLWGVVNGVAVFAVAAALVLLLSWSARALDHAAATPSGPG